MNLAVIPARGGSKRLPRKNLREFAGRPLLWYSVAVARRIPEIDRCIVSTDEPAIAEVASAFGAEVDDRPAELSGDTVPLGHVVRDLLGRLTPAGPGDAVVLLQPCCPLRSVALVRHALAAFHRERPDSVISVSPTDRKAGRIERGMFRPDYVPETRSQDMAPAYVENGAVYVAAARRVRRTGELFGSRILPIITEPWLAHGDIDTEFDLVLAEFLYQRYVPALAEGLASPASATAVS